MPQKQLPALLRLAASAGSRRTVEFHLRRGQDVDATDARGRTLLLIAAAKGHADICRLLIEAGADPSLCDSEGFDALSAAIRNGQEEAEAVLRASILPPSRESADSATESAADDEELGLGDWEELTESQPPLDNPALRAEARELQNRISRHAAIDADDDWSDVDIDLPDETQRYQVDRAAWLNEVRALMLVGMSWGFVTENSLAELVRHSGDHKHADDDIEVCLRTAFGDMGLSVIEVPDILEPLFNGGPSSSVLEDAQQADVDDAITFIAHLLSPHGDPVVCYYEAMRRVEAPKVRAIRRSLTLGVSARRVRSE